MSDQGDDGREDELAPRRDQRRAERDERVRDMIANAVAADPDEAPLEPLPGILGWRDGRWHRYGEDGQWHLLPKRGADVHSLTERRDQGPDPT